MKIINLSVLTLILFVSSSANAALVSRLGGLVYYDAQANITWVADANISARTDWADANVWVTTLECWRGQVSQYWLSADYTRGSNLAW